jgi:hypothetical protein
MLLYAYGLIPGSAEGMVGTEQTGLAFARFSAHLVCASKLLPLQATRHVFYAAVTSTLAIRSALNLPFRLQLCSPAAGQGSGVAFQTPAVAVLQYPWAPAQQQGWGPCRARCNPA